MTRVLRVDRDRPEIEAIHEAARVLRSGGLVAFPTETVYGLAADATSETAVRRIFEAKGRPSNNPLIVHAADRDGAKACCSTWPEEAERLSERFWPGPLTFVLPRADWVPRAVSAGLGTVGVRVPAPAVSRALIAAVGRPLAAPSANRSTGISPSEAGHVLKDLEGKVDLVLDAGPCSVGIESTVVDLSVRPPRLLRPGMVGLAELESVLGRVEGPGAVDPSSAFASPGQMEIHYAPRTTTRRISADRAKDLIGSNRVAVLDFSADSPISEDYGRIVRLPDPVSAAERLYSVLHEIDGEGWESILLVEPLDLPEWRAIRDRVGRAGRPITWPPSGPAPA